MPAVEERLVDRAAVLQRELEDMRQVQLTLIEALNNIAETTEEADTARAAYQALFMSDAGIAFVRASV